MVRFDRENLEKKSNHILSLTECKISSGDNEIFAVHSFGEEVCFDNSRLNVVQTQFGSIVEFSLRQISKFMFKSMLKSMNHTLHFFHENFLS